MNQISKIFLLPAAFFCFAACSNDDGFAPAQGGGSGSPVVVRAAVGEGGIYTRTNPEATDADEQKKFREGDKIKIIDADYKFESDYTLNADGVWQPDDPASFLKWQSRKGNHFQGVYPADGRNSFVKWHVEKDQTTIEGLRASDVMNYDASNVDEPANHILNVEFTRQTARLVVEIATYRDQYTATDNPVTALTVSGCEIDNSSDEQQGDVQAYKLPGEGAPQRFVALVLGGTRKPDASDDTFLTLTVKNSQGGDDVLTVKGVPRLDAGNSYNLKLAIGKDKAEIASVTVNPWNNGGEIIPGDKEAERANKQLGPLVSAEDLGKVVGSDGYIYSTGAEAQAATGAKPVAMIAYVGPETGAPQYNHGLAFGLDGFDQEDVSDISLLESLVERYTAEVPTPQGAGAWKIPSREDLVNIFVAFGGGVESWNPGGLVYYGNKDGRNFYNKLMDCGGRELPPRGTGRRYITTSYPVTAEQAENGYAVWAFGFSSNPRRYYTGSWEDTQDVSNPRFVFAF